MFKTYNEAYDAAVRRARETLVAGIRPEACEIGLEFNDLFKTYSIMALPMPQHRSGWELRCEVVRPSDPLIKR